MATKNRKKTELVVETRNINELREWDKNPRTIKDEDFQRLKNQIKELGVYKPLLVNQDGVVLGGNMRLRAYRELGLQEVDVVVVDAKTKDKMIKYALSDNDRAGAYDEQALIDLIGSVPEIDLGDFKVDLGEPQSLDELMIDLGEIIEDEAPAVEEGEPVSKLGEVYQLGRHRLMCGDATKIDDVEKLMDGKKADMVFTDPPYNIDYQGGMNANGQNKREGILNDSMDGDSFYQFLHDSISNMMMVTEGSFYICMSSKELPNLKKAFEDVGGHWQSFIIWVKNTFTLSRSDYQNQYEPILYGWNKSVKNHYFAGYRNVGNVWYETNQTIKYEDGRTIIRIGDVKLEFDGKVSGRILRRKVKTDIWSFKKPSISEEHPTMKPIELCATAITDSSRQEEMVLDLFGGSGSTLIAAEQTNRVCYMMELDPHYVDVIRKRYAKFIGKEDEWQEVTKRVQ